MNIQTVNDLNIKNDKDDQLKKFYKNEYEEYLINVENLNQESLDLDSIKTLYAQLNRNYYKALKKMMKITNIGDTTQYKLIKVQETLREQEEKLRAIFNNAIIGIATINLNEEIISVNHNLTDMLNLVELDLLITSFEDYIYIEDKELFKKNISKIIDRNQNQFRIQIRITNSEGYFWSDVSASSIKDHNGNPEAVILIIADIDEQVKAQIKLKESYQKLQDAQNEIIGLERKNTVLAMAVTANHEINQPLMILEANIEMLFMSLPEELKNEKINRYIKRASESVERIVNILEHFKKNEIVEFEDYGGDTNMVSFNCNEEE